MQVNFSTSPQRILIVKPSSIGDVVHALPVLNLLRKKWPNAHISWMLTHACKGLLEGHPQVNAIVEFDRKRFGTGWWNPSAALGFARFLKELRASRYDLVIDLQGLFRSGFLSWITRAPARIGFANARELGWLFYSDRVPIHTMEQHAIERYLQVADTLGCGREPVEFHFATTDDDRRYVASLLPENKPYAVLMPGANWVTKRWPVEHFAALTQPLRERFNLLPVIAGGPDAAEPAQRIDGINLVGKTNLRQLVALLERADLVIANDSGPMHIAAALGRPLVTMFGPTNPIRTGPYRRTNSVVRVDVPCGPCYSRQCSHTSCMKWLTAEMVLAAAQRQLASNR